MPLRASSSGLVISAPTAPGDAPGYCTEMKTTGGEMSGICSTPSRWYENNPSTHNATMTMVAKTGLLMETRVIHMGTLLEVRPWERRGSAGNGGGGGERLGRGRGRDGDDAGLGAFAQVVEARAQHRDVRRQAFEHLGALPHRIAATRGHGAAQQLAALDRPHVFLARGRADRADRHGQARRGVADLHLRHRVLAGAHRLLRVL